MEKNNVNNEESNEKRVEEPALKFFEESKGEDQELDTTSLDLIWKHIFQELDQWRKHAEFRDEVFLKEAMYLVGAVKRNQENIKSVSEKFQQELADWERAAREEILMSTTTLQHFFPRRSYEEINKQINSIQSRTLSILNTPINLISSSQLADQYLDMLEQYLVIRKTRRKQYHKAIKQAASLIYESQKGFVELFTSQIKSFLFPLEKYMEKPDETIKS